MTDMKKMSNKCSNCCKKVGLLGFKCKCANDKQWCSACRFPKSKPTDTTGHDCNFDYRQLGRDIITGRNPTIVATKIDKI